MHRERDQGAIEDCLYAIGHIEDYVQDISSPEALLSDSKTYDAVLMNFIIIGEAANRLSTEFKNSHDTIDWRSITAFRNFVAHDYFGVDVNILWAAIQYHLPDLKNKLQIFG